MYLKRLRDLREDSDLKQTDIARMLNISRQQYGLYEIGKRDLPVEFLKTLSQFYNVSSDYILELTDNSEPINRK